MKEQKKRDQCYWIHSPERMDSIEVSDDGRAGLERKHKRDIRVPRKR